MPNTRPNIPLNVCILSTLRACVQVSCEPPGVNAHHFLVLLIHGDVRGGGQMPIASTMVSLHPVHQLRNRSSVDGKTKDHGDILQYHRGLATRKVECVGLWTPLVHKCHQHDGVHQRQTAGKELSKRQEPRMMYEQLLPVIPS
jgi:hypothetical protein